jgi:serine protease Do
MTTRLASLVVLAALAASGFAQNREAKVRKDRTELLADQSWIYNDFAKGFATAKKTGRPMLVVIRCIP